MRVIIAGSRSFEDNPLDQKHIRIAVKLFMEKSRRTVTEVVSGNARGIDKMGEDWAKLQGIPIKDFPADWDKHGKAAGHIRNKQMAEYAEGLVAIWDGESKGTTSMINFARKHCLAVLVYKPYTNSFYYVEEDYYV